MIGKKTAVAVETVIMVKKKTIAAMEIATMELLLQWQELLKFLKKML